MGNGNLYSGWWSNTKSKPHRKEKKRELAEWRYQKALEKWYASEPPEWRIFSHAIWWRRRPKYPKN